MPLRLKLALVENPSGIRLIILFLGLAELGWLPHPKLMTTFSTLPPGWWSSSLFSTLGDMQYDEAITAAVGTDNV